MLWSSVLSERISLVLFSFYVGFFLFHNANIFSWENCFKIRDLFYFLLTIWCSLLSFFLKTEICNQRIFPGKSGPISIASKIVKPLKRNCYVPPWHSTVWTIKRYRSTADNVISYLIRIWDEDFQLSSITFYFIQSITPLTHYMQYSTLDIILNFHLGYWTLPVWMSPIYNFETTVSIGFVLCTSSYL